MKSKLLVSLCIFAILNTVSSSVSTIDSNDSNTSNLIKLQNDMKAVMGELVQLKKEKNQLQVDARIFELRLSLTEQDKRSLRIDLNSTIDELATLKQEKNNLQLEVKSQEQDILQMMKERDTRNEICQIRNHPCGNCLCIEDYNLMDKYFCDCRAIPTRRDCKEHRLQGEKINGLYKISKNINGRVIQVFCDQTTDGGGWTILQRRMDGSENFFRNWTEYKLGFGQLHREHWLGNEYTYLLTAQAYLQGSELRFDMMVKDDSRMRWAKYSRFDLFSEHTDYRLHVSGYVGGNAGEQFLYHNNMKFTTYDQDNDLYSAGNCAYWGYGAWWHKDCVLTNLNGQYDRYNQNTEGKHFKWQPNRLTFSEMKVRRK